MIVVARAKNLSGPWENMPGNPLVHTWKMDEQWQSKGHGSLVDTPKGDWYVVFHTYEKCFQSLGRNTMIEPVTLTKDGWMKAPLDTLLEKKTSLLPMQIKRDLGAFRIGYDWKAYIDYNPCRYQIENRSLTMSAQGDNPASSSPLLFVAGSHRYEITVKIQREGNTVAGITLYYNKDHYAGLGFDAEKRYRFRRAQRSRSGSCRGNQPLWLKVRMVDNVMTSFTSTDGVKWNKEISSIELSGYHHNTLGDYQSVLPGLFVYGDGKATFSDFSFRDLTY